MTKDTSKEYVVAISPTPENVANIPAKLLKRDQWVLWRVEQRDDGKPTKVPYQTNGRKAKSNKASTWTTFNEAFQAYEAGNYDGIGFVFSADDPYVGIDLDDCRDPATGEIKQWAADILESFRSTYAEVSPSGTGVKIWARGKLPIEGTGKKKGHVEMYQHGRYFAMTGEKLPQHAGVVTDCQDAITKLWEAHFAKPVKPARLEQNDSEPISPIDEGQRRLSRLPDAISGEGGHNATFHAACECWRWADDEQSAWEMLSWFNSNKCQPEWSKDELRHKCDDARQKVEEAGEIGSRLKHRQIEIGPDELRVTDQAIAALANRDDIFQRGGVLVEIRETPDPPPNIIRVEGGVRAVQLPEARLRELIADSTTFFKRETSKEGEKRTRVRVPQIAVGQVMARGRWPNIPTLQGIVSAPQFLHDGSVLTTPGYDHQSGLYLSDSRMFAPVPSNPTQKEVKDALKRLLDIVSDFPCDEVNRAGWLSLVLTAHARHAIAGPVPLYAFDANVRGSGKSLMADAAGLIATGRQLPRTSFTGDDNEMRKRITATLLAGEPLVLLDNVAGVLGCSSLDAILTSTIWSDRILGMSQMTTALPATAIWIATGNNLAFGADTARRTVRIRLESGLENPEERSGFCHRNLLAWVRRKRGQLASAAVTILRAYHVTGRPDMKLPAWGSFDAWSRLVRNVIAWLGLPDPGAMRQMVQRESDHEAILLRQLLNAWESADPSRHGLSAVDAIQRAEDGEVALANVFAELAGKDGKTHPKSLGMKLHHLRGRVCDGRFFDKRDTRQGALWFVKSTGGCTTSTTSATISNAPKPASQRKRKKVRITQN